MTISMKNSIVLFISLAIFTALSGRGNAAESKYQLAVVNRWYVHVVNGFGEGRWLFVHCQSKDNDLGPHDLAPGKEFSWTFKTSPFGSTLFWCYLRTEEATNKKHAAFDVFRNDGLRLWLLDYCGDEERNCIWTAKDDGIYLKINSQNHDVLVHKWQPGW